MSTTLKAARRAWVSLITSDPGYFEGLEHRAHQDEYILPVFTETLMSEVMAIQPPDSRRMVLAVMNGEGWVGYQFHFWGNDADGEAEATLPGRPRSLEKRMREAPADDLIPHNFDSRDVTVGDLMEIVKRKGPRPEDPTFGQVFDDLVAEHEELAERRARRARQRREDQ